MNNLAERLLDFSANCILFLRKLPNTEEYRVIKKQLIRSSSSVGANYEESQGASSKADFTNKVRISLKEARESNYWLRLLKKINTENIELEIEESLIIESQEIKNILGAICSKTTRKDG